MKVNPFKAQKTTVFKAPIKKMSNGKSSSYVIDLDKNGSQDEFYRTPLLGIPFAYDKVRHYEPEVNPGLIDALKDNPGTYDRDDLGKVKVKVPAFRTDGAELWGALGGGYSKTKSLNWVAEKATPVNGTTWAIEIGEDKQAWFLLQK